jgi:hypothetical protein
MKNKLNNGTLMALQDIRKEITRVNKAAGETIFNPALTQSLDSILDEQERIQGLPIEHYAMENPQLR